MIISIRWPAIVERNAARANLVRRAEQWRWGSLHCWLRGSADQKAMLAAWPLARKASWVDHVNDPLTEAELAAVRRSIHRGCPFGSEAWTDRAARRLGLESTLRPQGRPRKSKNGS
jgi:putative transposase